MSHSEFKPPRRAPSRRGHLERLAGDYGRAHGIAHERARRWLSLVSFAGALDSVRADDWREPYAAAAGELNADLPLDVDSAADQVRDFIAAIDGAG